MISLVVILQRFFGYLVIMKGTLNGCEWNGVAMANSYDQWGVERDIKITGMWSSMAGRVPWEHEVVGSNPAIPTKTIGK